MVMCLDQGADLHMAKLMLLPLTISCSSKSRVVSPSWCQLTRVVLDKIQVYTYGWFDNLVLAKAGNKQTHHVMH